jgi:hypothetical protein
MSFIVNSLASATKREVSQSIFAYYNFGEDTFTINGTLLSDMEKVINYLDKTNIFYVTAEDGDKPKCRPFSFKIVYDDKIYFGIGSFKDCFHQLEQNPNVEICASDGKGFLRYYEKASNPGSVPPVVCKKLL